MLAVCKQENYNMTLPGDIWPDNISEQISWLGDSYPRNVFTYIHAQHNILQRAFELERQIIYKIYYVSNKFSSIYTYMKIVNLPNTSSTP